MRFPQTPALLPAGLRDLLPPESMLEARLIAQMTGLMAANGYDLVKPPLVEFEETLLSGSGQSLARQTFRLMDPLSQRMMAVRRDITLQVARIARSRLGNSPRPLRLAYSGEVLRVSGTQLYPERQFCQVGCELIGSEEAAADAEIVLLAVACLNAAGIGGVSIDLGLPTLVPSLLRAYDIAGGGARRFLDAAEHRDPRQVKELGADKVTLFEKLIASSGPADAAMAALDALALPGEAQGDIDRLRRTIGLIRREAPDTMLTVDPLERRGFEYHKALSFTVFVQEHGEIGRGGRYRTGDQEDGEPAVGFTLLTDNLLRAMPRGKPAEKVLVPGAIEAAILRDLQGRGYVTVRQLEPGDPAGEARRLGCAFYWSGDGLKEIR